VGFQNDETKRYLIEDCLRDEFVSCPGAVLAEQRSAKGQRMRTEKEHIDCYLSRTGNTKAIAEIIHQKVGGKLAALELQRPYPTDYHATH